jgi:hypothetical protein
MRQRWAPLAALLVLSTACGARAEPSAAPRVEIPIRQTRLTDGAIRYSIPITVGQTQLDAMLDTGSTGVRVLPGAVAAGDFTATGQPEHYDYGSGADLTGIIAQAVIGAGGLTTRKPMRIEAVTKVGCVARKPNCAASRVSEADYGIGGDGLPREGFKAIVGVDMASAPAQNPLPLLGARAWIVVLPRPGDAAAGVLILNPTDAERQGYLTTPLDPIFDGDRGGFHDAVPGCLIKLATKQSVCGPLLMDTGAPGIQVTPAQNERPLSFARGDPAAIAFVGRGAPSPGFEFKMGETSSSHIAVLPTDGQPRARVAAGSLPYFAFSVLYDDQHHLIGIKAR